MASDAQSVTEASRLARRRPWDLDALAVRVVVTGAGGGKLRRVYHFADGSALAEQDGGRHVVIDA